MKKNSGIVYRLLIVSAAFWTMACASSPIAHNPSGKGITIKAIKDHPDMYAGRTVVLTGQFKGWKGSCRETLPQSRSDWMVEDETGCIYVNGTVPDGLRPMSPNDETIALTGTVRLTTHGVPYLEVQRP
jgi:hypothetical protein